MDPATLFLITLVGAIGVFITFLGLPGPFIVLLALLIYGFQNNFTEPSTNIYVLFVIITILASFADNIAVFLGAGKFGSSKYGLLGVFLGSIIGTIFFFPIGIILGPFVGAFIAEFIASKDLQKSVKVSIGTVIGYISGIILKAILAIALFTWLMFIIWL